MSQAAARRFDRIAHKPGFLAGLVGAGVGGVVGALVSGSAMALVGNIAGPGAGINAMGATIMQGAAQGMELGRALARSVRALFGLSDPTTGLLWSGAARVEVNGRRAIRAKLDKGVCHGRWFIEHFPKPAALVATGSATVSIEGQPAGRVGDLLSCSAKIKTGSANVVIGGAPMPVVTVTPTRTQRIHNWLNEVAWELSAAALVPLIVATVEGLRGSKLSFLLCLIRWQDVTEFSHAETTAQVRADLEARYTSPGELQDAVDALVAKNHDEIIESLEKGYYGSPRHRQFAAWVSDMTDNEITIEQAMSMQPYGGDLGPATGVVADGIAGRHSMIHDVEGFLGWLDIGPGYGGHWPKNKLSGQVEGFLSEFEDPSTFELH